MNRAGVLFSRFIEPKDSDFAQKVGSEAKNNDTASQFPWTNKRKTRGRGEEEKRKKRKKVTTNQFARCNRGNGAGN